MNTEVETTQTKETVLVRQAPLIVEPDAKMRRHNKLMTTVGERERVPVYRDATLVCEDVYYRMFVP